MDVVACVLLALSWWCRGFLHWFTLAVFLFVIRHFRHKARLLLCCLLLSQVPVSRPDCIAVCIGLLQLYVCRNFRFWEDRYVPSLVPQPLVGNLLPLFALQHGPATFFQQVYDSAPGRPYVGFYIFDKPVLMIRDPQLLRHILVKNFPSFMDRLTNARADSDPLGAANLFCLRGVAWRRVRAHVSPTFTSGKLKDVFGDMVQTAESTRDWILVWASRGVAVNVKDVLTRTALDIICTCLFGIKSASLNSSECKFRLSAIKMMKWTVTRAVEVLGNFFEPRLVQMLPIMLFQRDATSFLRDALMQRLGSGQSSGSYLDLVTRCLNGNTGVTEEELLAQGLIFFGAGFETTATIAMLALYELARHRDVQTELRDELKRVLAHHDGQLTYTAVQDMTFLNMVVSETLRLYPPMAFVDRICTEDCRLPGDDGLVIQAGTPVFVSLLGIQRDPLHFEDPLRFDPRRFSSENKHNIKPFTYIPFGDGPRNCIGSRFGLLSVKVMLAVLLQEFEVHVHPNTPRTLTLTPYSLLLRVLGPLPLTFVIKPIKY